MNTDSDRQQIFKALKQALRAGADPTPLPDYEESLCVSPSRTQGTSLWNRFQEHFQAVNGRTIRSVSALATFLQDHGFTRGFCDPALKETLGDSLEREGVEVLYQFERERLNEYHFGITRASGAIAESGSLILKDEETVDRLAALAPWVHVAVLSVDQLVATIPEAIARFGNSPNIVWVTGPSKTGDIEGILIEGVHGPGEQICFCPEP